MRLAWATDIHLDHLEPEEVTAFGHRAGATNADALLVTGDIANADTFAPLLNEAQRAFARPVYFVLGNHDYYGGSFAEIDAVAASLQPPLHWLRAAGVVPLTEEIALVGTDGLYDAGWGDVGDSIHINDRHAIYDFRAARSKWEMAERAKKAATRLAFLAEGPLRAAMAHFRKVFFATHVPPFREAAWGRGRGGGATSLPWYTSRVMGEMLERVAAAHPTTELHVLCGHTHTSFIARVAANIVIQVGAAEYGQPALADVFDL